MSRSTSCRNMDHVKFSIVRCYKFQNIFKYFNWFWSMLNPSYFSFTLFFWFEFTAWELVFTGISHLFFSYFMASAYLSNSKSGCGTLCLDNSTTLPDGSAFFAPSDTSHMGLGLKKIKISHHCLVKKIYKRYKNWMGSYNHILSHGKGFCEQFVL